jgi:hypothetical protein
MGQFSWYTSNDSTQIVENRSRERAGMPPQTIYLIQPNGLPPIKEESYEGYGVFGGVDVFSWIAFTHGLIDDMFDGEKRMVGHALMYDTPELMKFELKFSTDPTSVYEELSPSKDDPNQGWLSDEADEDDWEDAYDEDGDGW